jgi:hypothetical protein
LKLLEGVETKLDPDTTIATMSGAQKEQETEVAADEVAPAGSEK